VTFPNFAVAWAKSFLKRVFEVIPFQNAYMLEEGFSSMMTIKQDIDLN